MREDSFGHDVLDEAETDTKVDVFDVKRVLATETNVHHSIQVSLYSYILLNGDYIPNFVQILPKLHLAGI